MKKRTISLALALVMTLSSLSAGTPALALGVAGDPIVEGTSSTIDILVNAGEGSSVLASDLTDALYTKLKARLAEVGLENVNVRISAPKLDLNTSDTSNWYVYDHYDTAWYANQAAWAAAGAVGNNANTTLRPYFSHTNATGTVKIGTGSNGTAQGSEITAYDQNKLPKMTIQQWVNGPKPYNYNNPRTAVTLGAFDQHIYNHMESGIAYMDFVGYDTYSYADFMFYPCPSKETKQVTFDVDSSNVNAHSLNGAGFLINAGIDKDGYLLGYYLYYYYASETSTSPDAVYLYKIKPNVKAADIHNATVDTSGSDMTKKGIVANSDLLESKTKANFIWAAQMSVRLTITSTAVLVEQKAKGDTGEYTTVLTVAKNSGKMSDTGYNGFGPIVHYKQSGHTCVRASQFTYSNVKMAYINQSNEIFDVLSQSDYLQNSEKYFVDLTDNGENRSLNGGEDGTAAAAYMQTKEIRYITNHTNDLLNDGGKGFGPLGENGKTIYKSGGAEGETNIDELAKQIAEYVEAHYGKPFVSPSDVLPLSSPVALLSLVKDADATQKIYVDVVRRDLVNGTLPIFGYDIASKPSAGKSITTYNYTIAYPDGRPSLSFTNAAPNQPILSMSDRSADWPTGEYSVTLTATDTSGQTSAPVTAKFTVVEDTVAPAVPSATISDGKLSFTASDVGGYGVAGYELAFSPVPGGIGFKYGGKDYFEDSAGETLSVSTTPKTDLQTISDIELPVGEYTMVLIVYDVVGNRTTVQLPTIDYVNEQLIGLVPNQSHGVLGTPDAAGKVLIADAVMTGLPSNYVSPNTPALADSAQPAPAPGSTLVTLTIPVRPEAPTGIQSVITGSLSGKLTHVDDTMAYKKTSDPSYTLVPDGETEIIVLSEDFSNYYVRSNAVPAQKFASKPKTVSVQARTVSGTVQDGNNAPVADALVELYDGGAKISGPVTTDSSGKFSLPNVPDGTYKLVVTDPATGSQTPVLVVVTGGDVAIAQPIPLLGGTEITVDVDPSVPVLVGGLPELPGTPSGDDDKGVTQADLDMITGGGKMSLVFTAKELPAGTPKATALKAEAAKSKESVGLYMDLLLDKYIWTMSTDSNPISHTSLTESPTLLDVRIPLDSLGGKVVSSAYRTTAGITAALPLGAAAANGDGEYYELDAASGHLILHMRKLGSVALAYSDPSAGEPTPPVDGGTSTPIQPGRTVDASAGTGGTISNPGKTTLAPGKSETYTISPNKRHRILDVLVNGKSIGAVSNYTVSDPKEDVVIRALFVPADNFIADVSARSGGAVSNPGRVAFEPGVSLSYTFTPDGGYYIRDVIINGVSLGAMNSYTINSMDQDITIIAVFAPLVALNTEDHFAYIIGYPDGLAHPNGNLTREEAATIFFRLLTAESNEAYLSYTNGFSDVDSGRWSNCAISTLANAGIIQGKTAATFDPRGTITRAEFAAMASRFSTIQYSGEKLFSDVSGHWAESEINSAASHGWVVGHNRMFRPDDTITRAEVMTLVNRVLGRIPESHADLSEGMVIWKDNAEVTAWYYLAVQEATTSHKHVRKSDGAYEKWETVTDIPDWIVWER